jgi:D-alanyl-D-alanine carboxypeptidase
VLIVILDSLLLTLYLFLVHLFIMSLSDTIQSILDAATADPSSGIPGLAFTAVDKKGTVLTANASGTRGRDSEKAMTVDTVLWIASCTKLITAIAAMQLVEKGVLNLDDTEEVRIVSTMVRNLPFNGRTRSRNFIQP